MFSRPIAVAKNCQPGPSQASHLTGAAGAASYFGPASHHPHAQLYTHPDYHDHQHSHQPANQRLGHQLHDHSHNPPSTTSSISSINSWPSTLGSPREASFQPQSKALTWADFHLRERNMDGRKSVDTSRMMMMPTTTATAIPSYTSADDTASGLRPAVFGVGVAPALNHEIESEPEPASSYSSTLNHSGSAAAPLRPPHAAWRSTQSPLRLERLHPHPTHGEQRHAPPSSSRDRDSVASFMSGVVWASREPATKTPPTDGNAYSPLDGLDAKFRFDLGRPSHSLFSGLSRLASGEGSELAKPAGPEMAANNQVEQPHSPTPESSADAGLDQLKADSLKDWQSNSSTQPSDWTIIMEDSPATTATIATITTTTTTPTAHYIQTSLKIHQEDNKNDVTPISQESRIISQVLIDSACASTKNIQDSPDPSSLALSRYHIDTATEMPSSAHPEAMSNATTLVESQVDLSHAQMMTASHALPLVSKSKEISTNLTGVYNTLPDLESSSLSTIPSWASSSSQQSSSIPSGVANPLNVQTTTTPPQSTTGTQSPGLSMPADSAGARRSFAVRSRSSIPVHMSPRQYAAKCIEAADNSRLNPFALHPEEYLLLRDHLSHAQVTTYLHIRNGILRLWLLDPRIPLAREKAVGCAHWRWFDVASVCYDWLVRRGYINFGCVEFQQQQQQQQQPQKQQRPTTTTQRRQRTIVVIGAGFSGLGCARHLDGLFKQYSDVFEARGERPPRVVVIEGRERIGGRVYSRAFTRRTADTSSFPGQRHTAEMGGMIITGFERGNPLNVLVRGQLGLPYHMLNPQMTLYDSDGVPVDETRDHLVEQLYNDCLDRVSEYKFKTRPEKVISGNSALVQEGKDGAVDAQKTIAQEERERAALPDQPPEAEQNVADAVKLVPISADKVTGQIHTQPGNPASAAAAQKAQSFGWALRSGVTPTKTIELEAVSQAADATLGLVLDTAISQYRGIVDLGPLDFRLLNWHIANLEYSNATTIGNLSLGGWDIDAGNEWEGAHSMVIGGYQSVARGLMRCPKPLDVRPREAVVKIEYDCSSSLGPAVVTTDTGTRYEADCVVSTIPLGVMKARTIEYDPPLPAWKTAAVDRLGFGILNKVVLVYEKPFWDDDRDIFGVLRTPPLLPNSVEQRNYAAPRGRFFQWFNLTKPCGLPCLLALMAGDAGFETEKTTNDTLVREATEILRSVFGGPEKVPFPVEAIVTRWGSDPFSRGSYSSCAPDMQQDDYDALARPVGNLFFAGEHTIGTHPATVHGAYLSGLRAASEVIDALIGPIPVPDPIIRPREQQHQFLAKNGSGSGSANSVPIKRKQAATEQAASGDVVVTMETYEVEVLRHIVAHIGERPVLARRERGETAVGQENVKPAVHSNEDNYNDHANDDDELAMRRYKDDAAAWDSRAVELRIEYEARHPPPSSGLDEGDHYRARGKSRRMTRAGGR